MALTEKEINRLIFLGIIYDGHMTKIANASKVKTCTVKIHLINKKWFPYSINEGDRLEENLIPDLIEFSKEDIKFSEEKETPIEKEDISKIINLYKNHEGDLSEVVRQSKYSFYISKLVCILKGLPPKFKGKNINRSRPYAFKDIYEILESCETSGANASEVYKNTPHINHLSTLRILKFWEDYKLISPKREKGVKAGERLYGSTLPRNKVIDIIKAFQRYYGDSNLASKQMGCCTQTVLNIWDNAGLKKDEDGNLIIPKEISLETRTQSI